MVSDKWNVVPSPRINVDSVGVSGTKITAAVLDMIPIYRSWKQMGRTSREISATKFSYRNLARENNGRFFFES